MQLPQTKKTAALLSSDYLVKPSNVFLSLDPDNAMFNKISLHKPAVRHVLALRVIFRHEPLKRP